MKREVLASEVINTNDTPVRMQGQPEKSRIWVYVGDIWHPHTVYAHTELRKRDGPVEFLGGYKGNQKADAYGGYDGIYAGENVVEIEYWAHARRKYVEAQTSDPQRSLFVVTHIKLIYKVEQRATELRDQLPETLSPMERHERFVHLRYAMRQETSKGVFVPLCLPASQTSPHLDACRKLRIRPRPTRALSPCCARPC